MALVRHNGGPPNLGFSIKVKAHIKAEVGTEDEGIHVTWKRGNWVAGTVEG